MADHSHFNVVKPLGLGFYDDFLSTTPLYSLNSVFKTYVADHI